MYKPEHVQTTTGKLLFIRFAQKVKVHASVNATLHLCWNWIQIPSSNFKRVVLILERCIQIWCVHIQTDILTIGITVLPFCNGGDHWKKLLCHLSERPSFQSSLSLWTHGRKVNKWTEIWKFKWPNFIFYQLNLKCLCICNRPNFLVLFSSVVLWLRL